MKKGLFILPILALLAGCGFSDMKDIGGNHGPIDDADEHIPDGGVDDNTSSGEEIEIEIPDTDEDTDIETPSEIDAITDLTKEGIAYDNVSKKFTISKGGTKDKPSEFVFTGEFEGNIVIATSEEEYVKLTLNGFTIKSTTDAPIKCTSGAEFQLSLKKSSKNYVYDYRTVKTVDDDTQGNGAITSDIDMKVTGKGSLQIIAKYNNGIHCKDDLTLKQEVNDGSSIQIEAYNNALKGNDSVEIKCGNYVLISTNGNGILTENTKVTDKGNQKGSIIISGGQVDIYSAKDAIDAAYNAEISADDPEAAPIINIYTSKYSKYSNEVSETSEENLYLRLSNSINTSSYYYAVEFLSSDYYTTWAKATLASSSRDYKYLKVDMPSNATSLKVCCFANSVTTMSEDNAYAKMSSYQTINKSYDTAKLSIYDGQIYLNGWTSYTTNQGGGPGGGGPGGGGPGGGSEGNNDKAEVSAKGIKADNCINISAGTIFIKAYDDAIHANYGTALENSATGIGDVTISGGKIDIYASDDGLHADHALNVNGGTINIEYSYEGVEGNIINFTGGYTKVYSIDDGLNAANKSGVTPAIKVSGGIVDVTVYGQDVDGIDSNGSFTQTGGKVITKGGNSQMSTGLDVDGTATISGGTFVAFGRTEKTPSKGSGITSYSLSQSVSIGNYKITFADSTEVTVTTKYSYSIIYVYSDSSTKISVAKA